MSTTKHDRRPGIDLPWNDMPLETLQSLSGRKKILFEIENAIEAELPALRKIRGKRGQVKSHPYLTTKDLKLLLDQILQIHPEKTEDDLVILERLDAETNPAKIQQD